MVLFLIPLFQEHSDLIPGWFRNSDVIFEFTVLLVSLMIFFTAWKIYKYSKLKQFKWFSVSFLLFSLAFLSKIFSNIIIFYPIVKEWTLGNLTIVIYHFAGFYEFLYEVGITLYILFMLTGAFMLLKIISKSKERIHDIFYFYIIFIVLIFDSFTPRFMLFHLTMSLTFIVISWIYFDKYFILKDKISHQSKISQRFNAKNNLNKIRTLLFPAFAFLSLSISYLIPIFFKPCFYVFSFSEILQLLGFTLIFINYLIIKLR